MYKGFAVLVLAVIFLAVFLAPSVKVIVMVPVVAFLAVVTAVVNYLLHKKEIRSRYDLTFLTVPTFWILGTSAILFVQSSRIWQIVLGLIMVLMFVKLEMNILPKINSSLIDSLFFFSAAGVFLGIWAFEFYFTPAWWLVLILIFFASFSFYWASYYNVLANLQEKMIYSTVLAFLVTQISWALLFWPLHFVSITVVMLALLYLAWMIGRLHLQGTLKKNAILYHSGFSGLIIFIVVLTSNWIPKL
ncbi:MAG: hypothetical protein COT91_03065 [Candidatus Doudnabacteria bacterium CG10_big_fil_rev_8_21_14_0_10_41_10]|uniref:Uncharacterized protein n=1 Tax=Candidatus Doudnabacteria bacterium CG10_big_fil_rev_8_21_14_0_10_41_10 TaxID=1974551 RepID=A0A2H0VDF4_9BACT|nr:MAG: hypothetical protein COT91_03065 [Candidatus Doudnabacteria bacterium CG10_big_fil_rev_8_21_14_0_10_41_10]